MEVKINLVAVSIAAILGISWAWRTLNWVLLKPFKLQKLLREEGLSGNSYRLVFGDMIEATRMRNEASSRPMEFSHHILPRIDPFLHQTITNHGQNSFTWFGPVPVLTVNQPELIREVLSKANEFPKPHWDILEKILPGIATVNGEEWAKRRKLINPAFHMEKLKLMIPAFNLSCNEIMSVWEKMVVETGSAEFDLWPHLVNLTSDVISRAAFSSSYFEGRRAFELIEEQTQTFVNTVIQSFIPGWSYVPTKANRRFKTNQKEIRNIIRGIVDKRRTEMEAGEAVKDDLLGTLMECNLKEMKQDGNREMKLGMAMDEVVDECKVFYFAGQETTSVLLAFTMILLGRYTDWQTKAREEVLKVFGKRAPDFDGLHQLKIVTMILYEVLRLYPPVHSMWRKVNKDTKLGNLSLPAGVYLNFPVICSHHDPQHWGNDVFEFKPERFSEGISKATKEKFAFFPFGAGPRVCLGQNLALMEAKMALTMILQRFSFELSPLYVHAPVQLITIRPQFGAHIILHQL